MFILAQDCIGGSVYDDENANRLDSISRGYWYINLQDSCSCSGKVLKYKFEFYEVPDDGSIHVVHAAMWKPTEEDQSLYQRVLNIIIIKLLVTIISGHILNRWIRTQQYSFFVSHCI